MPLYGGIDRHANNSVIVLLNEPDEVIYRKRLPNELSTILAQLAPYHTALKGLVVESTFNWYWFVDGLMEADFRVHLANRLPRCIGEIFGGRLQLSVYKGIADT
jgi:transposase